MICGVDEAGKGPVIGPLVVAAVAVKNAKDIQDLGVKDSKQLNPVCLLHYQLQLQLLPEAL